MIDGMHCLRKLKKFRIHLDKENISRLYRLLYRVERKNKEIHIPENAYLLTNTYLVCMLAIAFFHTQVDCVFSQQIRVF